MLSIRELGILRAVQVPSDGIADVVITPTYSGCPAVEQIRQDIIDRLRAHGMQARVSVQLAPAWTTDWIDAAAREKLRAFGIAPPAATADARAEGPMQAVSAGYRVSLFGRGGTDAGVCCPRCGSANTRELAHFASTACKALYRCMACREPFDYFKPH